MFPNHTHLNSYAVIIPRTVKSLLPNPCPCSPSDVAKGIVDAAVRSGLNLIWGDGGDGVWDGVW